MARQSIPDSRRARLEALTPGRAITEHENADEMDDVPSIVKRLHKVWGTAIMRVKLDHPDRRFVCTRERIVQRNNVQIKFNIKRIS